MNIRDEIQEISKLIQDAHLMAAVRREVRASTSSRSLVMDGKHAEDMAQGSSRYSTVIVLKDGDKEIPLIARRIKANIPDVDVTELVKGVLGIRHTRRGGH